MSPEEEAVFRARLAGSGDDYVRGPNADSIPAPSAPGLFERLQASGGRLAANPALQGALGGSSLSPIAAASTFGAALGGSVNGDTVARDTPRAMTSFARESGDPAMVQLRPMQAGQELTLPTTPTLASMRAPASASGGYGGGGSGMGGLANAYKQAQSNQFGTLDEQRDLVERRGELQGERINKMADMQELDAARKHRDAEVMAQHQAQVAAKHDAFLARNQQLADEIGAEKIDPARIMGDKSLGEKLSLVISGMLSGAIGQGPAAMARVDNMIGEGVKAQIANVDNKKAKLGARQNLFGQMMAESGDRRTAELQTTQLMHEAVAQKLKADAERLGIPEVTNNAEMAANAIVDQRVNPLRVQMTGAALQAAQAQAAAAATAQRQAEERAWTRGMEVAKLGQEADKIAIERGKADKAAGQGPLELEAAKAQMELIGHVAALKKADMGAVTAGSNAGHIAATTLPGWLPGVSGAMKNDDAREAYNRQGMIAVGAAYKIGTDATEPKRKEMLEHFFAPYKVEPGTPDDVAETRRANLVKLLEDNAAAKGAALPSMPDSVKRR